MAADCPDRVSRGFLAGALAAVVGGAPEPAVLRVLEYVRRQGGAAELGREVGGGVTVLWALACANHPRAIRLLHSHGVFEDPAATRPDPWWETDWPRSTGALAAALRLGHREAAVELARGRLQLENALEGLGADDALALAVVAGRHFEEKARLDAERARAARRRVSVARAGAALVPSEEIPGLVEAALQTWYEGTREARRLLRAARDRPGPRIRPGPGPGARAVPKPSAEPPEPHSATPAFRDAPPSAPHLLAPAWNATSFLPPPHNGPPGTLWGMCWLGAFRPDAPWFRDGRQLCGEDLLSSLRLACLRGDLRLARVLFARARDPDAPRLAADDLFPGVPPRGAGARFTVLGAAILGNCPDTVAEVLANADLLPPRASRVWSECLAADDVLYDPVELCVHLMRPYPAARDYIPSAELLRPAADPAGAAAPAGSGDASVAGDAGDPWDASVAVFDRLLQEVAGHLPPRYTEMAVDFQLPDDIILKTLARSDPEDAPDLIFSDAIHEAARTCRHRVVDAVLARAEPPDAQLEAFARYNDAARAAVWRHQIRQRATVAPGVFSLPFADTFLRLLFRADTNPSAEEKRADAEEASLRTLRNTLRAEVPYLVDVAFSRKLSLLERAVARRPTGAEGPS